MLVNWGSSRRQSRAPKVDASWNERAVLSTGPVVLASKRCAARRFADAPVFPASDSSAGMTFPPRTARPAVPRLTRLPGRQSTGRVRTRRDRARPPRVCQRQSNHRGNAGRHTPRNTSRCRRCKTSPPASPSCLSECERITSQYGRSSKLARTVYQGVLSGDDRLRAAEDADGPRRSPVRTAAGRHERIPLDLRPVPAARVEAV